MIRPDNAFYLGRSVRGLKVINDKYPGANGMDDLDAPGSVTIDYIRTDGDRCRTFYLNGVYTGPFTFGRVFMFHEVKRPTGSYAELKEARNFNYSPEEVIELGDDIIAIRIGLFPTAPLSYKDGDPFLYELSAAGPHYKDLRKAYKKESEQEFFRTSVDGSVAFFGKDFEYISGSPLESDFVFLVSRPAARQTGLNFARNIYAKSRFAKTDCSIDFAARKCEPKLQVLDEYTAILDRYEDKVDLVKLAPGITRIGANKRAVIQMYAPGSSVVTNTVGSSSWDVSVTEVIDDEGALQNDYHFSYMQTLNEIYLKDDIEPNFPEDFEIEAVFPGLLGTYAGLNGLWRNKAGYTIELGSIFDYGIDVILKTPDGKAAYRGQWINGYNLSSGDVHMTNTGEALMRLEYDSWQEEIEAVSPDMAYKRKWDLTMEVAFVFRIHRRLLVDNNYVGDSDTYELLPNDFTGSYPNYGRCIGLGRDAVSTSLFCSAKTSPEPTKYGINDYGEYFVAPTISAGSGFGRAIPVMKTNWANASVWFAYGTDYGQFDEMTRSGYTLRDNFSLAEVVRALLRKAAPGITHEATPQYSEFFYGSFNPISFGSFGVFLTQKTNVLKGDYDQAAQKAETTLKEVMDMLRSCFRCYWFVENGKFRIEHISYFLNGGSYSGSPGVGLDMTILADLFNRRMLSSFQRAVEYDKDQLPARYEFDYADQASDFFTGVSIDVNASYVDKGKTEGISVTGFSADVDMMIASPELFANEGLALLCAVKGSSGWELPIVTDRALVDENGRTYQSAIQNYYASWPYLARFYMHDMPGYDIDFSLSDGLSVTALKRCMTQTVSVPVSSDPDLYSSVVTDLGHGRIESMTVDMDTLVAEIGLSYIPS